MTADKDVCIVRCHWMHSCTMFCRFMQELDKIHLLDSYQSLSSENDRLETSAQQTLDEAAGVHRQLVDATRVSYSKWISNF